MQHYCTKIAYAIVPTQERLLSRSEVYFSRTMQSLSCPRKAASADMTAVGIGAETVITLGNPSIQSLLCND